MQATTIGEVIHYLDIIIGDSVTHSNRMGYFAALYKRVTVAVADKIKQQYFDDNARIEKLDVVFANRYLEAYQNYTNNTACTGSWCLAFDATKSWKPMVIHHLLAGMNAHISLDLGIAAATVCPGASINEIKNDFYRINTILSEMVNDVKMELFSMWPPSKWIIQLNTGKIENALAGFSMTVARDAAWQVALDYAKFDLAPNQKIYITERDKKVAEFGESFLYPKSWLSFAAGVLRVFEFGSVSSKINKLIK